MGKGLDSFKDRIRKLVIKLNIKHSANMRLNASIRAILSLRSMKELRGVAHDFKIKYYYRMKREELVEGLAIFIPSEEYLVGLMMDSPAAAWGIFEDVYNDGKVISEVDDVVSFTFLQSYGIMQSYYFEDRIHVIIPDEIRPVYEAMKRDGLIANKYLMNILDLYAKAAVSLYGAVEVSQFIKIVGDYCKLDIEKRDVDMLLSVRSECDETYLFTRIILLIFP